MRRTLVKNGGFMFLFFSLSLVIFGQSVAETAKKSREKNKNKKSTVVITNDMLKSGTTAGQSGDTIDVGKSSVLKTGNTSQDMVYQGYYVKFYKLYGQLELYTAEYEDANRRKWHSRARWATKEMKKLEKQIKALKDMARKDSVPSGIARQARKDVCEKLEEEGKLLK